MAKSYSLGVRLDADVRAALATAAKADQRTLSALASKILREWLTNNEWLKSDVDVR